MSSGPCILIVEDELGMVRLFAASLEDEGYGICDAATGRGGLTEVRTGKPDLILLDLGLPDVDGLSLVPANRQWVEMPLQHVRTDDALTLRRIDLASDVSLRPHHCRTGTPHFFHISWQCDVTIGAFLRPILALLLVADGDGPGHEWRLGAGQEP